MLVQNSHRSCDHVSNRVYRPPEPSPPPTHMLSNSNQFCLLMLQNGNSCHKMAAQTHVNNSTVRRVNSTITHHPPQVMLWVPNLVQKVTSGAADTATKLMRLLNWNLYSYTAKAVLTKEGLKSTVRQHRPILSKVCWMARLNFALEDGLDLE